MQTNSNHGGARPGAGRKPKNAPDTTPVSELLSTLMSDSEALPQIQTRLREQLPQLLEALMSLAQGATTTRERWVAAGTLTTGLGNDTQLLLPQLPPAQLVLVGIETYTHKPDSKALLFLLEHVLGNAAFNALATQPNSEATPTPEPENSTAPEDTAEFSESQDDAYMDRSHEWANSPDEFTLAPDGCTATLRQYPLPPRARPLTTKKSPTLGHINREAIPRMPPRMASSLAIPASTLIW